MFHLDNSLEKNYQFFLKKVDIQGSIIGPPSPSLFLAFYNSLFAFGRTLLRAFFIFFWKYAIFFSNSSNWSMSILFFQLFRMLAALIEVIFEFSKFIKRELAPERRSPDDSWSQNKLNKLYLIDLNELIQYHNSFIKKVKIPWAGARLKFASRVLVIDQYLIKF